MQLLPLRHTASLLHRARWLQFRRFSSHPIICLLMPLNALNSGSKEISPPPPVFWGGEKKRKLLQRHRLSASPAHSDCRDGASGREEKGPALPPLRGPSVPDCFQFLQRRKGDAPRNKGCLLKSWNLLQMFCIMLSCQPGQTSYTGNQRFSSQSKPAYVALRKIKVLVRLADVSVSLTAQPQKLRSS